MPEESVDQKKTEDQSQLKDLGNDELIDIIRSTRKEAGSYRTELKKLKEKQDQLDAEKRKEEEDKLKAEGDYKKLLADKEKEIESIKPKADAFEKLRLDEIEDAKKALGDQWLDEYSNLSITALRKTVQSLTKVKTKVDGVDDGRAKDPPKVELTEAQRKEAHEKFPYDSFEKAEEKWFEVLRKIGKIKV